MNILFLSDVYFPRINGVSTSIHTLRGQLVEMGHRVHLVGPDYFSPSDDESWITRVPSRYLPFDPEDRLMRYAETLNICAGRLRNDFDLIHVHTPFAAHYLGLRLAKRYGIPCVETYHTFFEDYLHHYLPVLPRPLLRIAARSLSRRQCNTMDAVVAPSQPMLDALRGYGVNVRVEVIPTGLEDHSFVAGDGAGFRQRYGIPLDRPVLLFVGRVAHEKNIGFLLRMMAQLRQARPDALLVIAGEGPALEAVRGEALALGLQDNIRFLGYLDRKTELNDCYRAADVFVFSSCTETQGLVLLEAMAQGVPVVAIAEMGTKSILREGEGALIAPLDEEAFAARVKQLLGDPALRKRLGLVASGYARQWSAASMAERMVEFYRDVVQPKAG
ncbi:MAG TPA: glycosyltransferase [Methylophilaceae bacterium]|nr:glycosyltransferase [Methylophilaceae bacterium]HQR59817.1 glycosyltransferase [Methylophilaceae bacterium]